MKHNTTKLDFLKPAAEITVDLYDNWFDPIEPTCVLEPRNSLENLSAASLTLCWHAGVTGEARWPAMKQERALRANATAAGRGR